MSAIVKLSTARDNRSMSYDVGTHIDLSHINTKRQVEVQKKTTRETARQYYDVGTQFVFNLTPQGLKTGIKIPVAFA